MRISVSVSQGAYINDFDWAFFIDKVLNRIISRNFELEPNMLGRLFGKAFYMDCSPRAAASSPLSHCGIGVVATGERKNAGRINRYFSLNDLAEVAVFAAREWVEMDFPLSNMVHEDSSLRSFGAMVKELIHMLGYQAEMDLSKVNWKQVAGHEDLMDACKDYERNNQHSVTVDDEY